ncbi:hypothetical protein P7C71_g1709, partial [Lecanoromycetidae sp. Uapishka_2]
MSSNSPSLSRLLLAPETQDFTREMGAAYVVNHREGVQKQIKDLDLHLLLKYIFIIHSTDAYLANCAAVAPPFGKVCSIVRDKLPMYGTEFMAKSVSLIWALLGTKLYYGVDPESHGKILKELAQLVDEGVLRCTLQQTFELNLPGLREVHTIVEKGGSIGKNGLEVLGDRTAFA